MEIPKPLALQPDKAQRQLGQQNCVWLSSEDSAGSEKEAAVQAWTKVTSHRTCRSCASFGVGLFFFSFFSPFTAEATEPFLYASGKRLGGTGGPSYHVLGPY